MKCALCDKEFTRDPKNLGQMYCSSRCVNYVSRAKRGGKKDAPAGIMRKLANRNIVPDCEKSYDLALHLFGSTFGERLNGYE